MALPFVSCLCPTYKRPNCLENSIACFLKQDYPGNAELIILDDAGQYGSCSLVKNRNWEKFPDIWKWDSEKWVESQEIDLMSDTRRYETLPAKYLWMAAHSRGDLCVVWEDDDIYLPWHISAHVKAQKWPCMHGSTGPLGQVPEFWWSKSSRVWSLYTGRLEQESSSGRFFASIAAQTTIFREILRNVQTSRLDFDQQIMAGLRELSKQPPADTILEEPEFTNGGGVFSEPSYIFRWASTNNYHGQSYNMETWYDDVEKLNLPCPRIEKLEPRFDDETERVYDSFLSERYLA